MGDSSMIFVAGGARRNFLDPRYANRHGLIAGATGTGKTVTLQVLAEGFSAAGVPVFVADVKGDLSGLSQAGAPHPKIAARLDTLGIAAPEFGGVPTIFWDLFGAQGHPVRTTVSEMGPLLLGRLLDLNEVQGGVLNIAFEVADEEGLLLIDLKDLRAMLNFVGDNARDIGRTYGNVGTASIGAIQRGLLTLEQQGGDLFFGESALAPGGTGRWKRPGGSHGVPPEPSEPAKSSRRGRRNAEPPRREEKQAKGSMGRMIFGDSRRQGLAEAMAKSAVRTVGRRIGSQIVRGVLGSLIKR